MNDVQVVETILENIRYVKKDERIFVKRSHMHTHRKHYRCATLLHLLLRISSKNSSSVKSASLTAEEDWTRSSKQWRAGEINEINGPYSCSGSLTWLTAALSTSSLSSITRPSSMATPCRE